MSDVISKFERRAEAVTSLVCVGLDPEIERIPERFLGDALPLFAFCRWIIEQTHSYAVAYKPNMAFFEARGALGFEELARTAEYLRNEHPEIVTVCDAKRADIGNTNRGYVTSIFDAMGFDAVTLHPYLGREALAPFLERKDKASIILCRTSNTGAGEFQDLVCEGKPLWERVAARVSAEWNANGNCMLVVGATYPSEMRRIREVAPRMPFLVPGVGAQGGDVAAVVTAGLDAKGKGLLISSSRGILFADDPAAAARLLRDEINVARETVHAAR
ncbi:orotidine-5'-phosphate decarboxylase [Granulicella sp. 5B5]|uniref:orotidine-5'-phosphate decarboxylase n=1 Tax=Granulicella sp. 5B5 TaxID=1617967 RepID=UPI0015F72564|nr:orotidine-5'-phosphate decarboxylase [Granulicella sp. 5B5]QMV19483.1 orotidine-5'-phosphate decarboxylase [Granulicella sp. 5B5]